MKVHYKIWAQMLVGAGITLLNACSGGGDSVNSSASTVSSATMSTSSSAQVSSSSAVSSMSASSAAVTSPAPIPSVVSQGVVRFIYFIEQGQEYEPEVFDALKTHAFAMQQYWYEQFGGTFYLYDQVVDVMYADHPDDWYLTTPDGVHSDERWYRLGNVKNEVYRKLAIDVFDAKVRIINYPTSRHDGRVGGNFGGAWMDGDDLRCLLGENNAYNFPYDDQNPAHCMGHVSHEFGHVFGLDHTGPSNDCMQYGFYIYSNAGEMCDFSAENRQIVMNEANNTNFLAAEPGQVVTPEGNIEAR